MSLSQMFKTDSVLEEKGFPVSYGKHETTGVEIVITIAFSGATNKKYQRALRRLTKPVERLIQNESLSDEQSEAIYKEVFAEACVIGWQGVYPEDLGDIKPKADSKELPFSKENAIKLFDYMPHLYADLVEKSKKLSNFKTQNLEDEAKN